MTTLAHQHIAHKLNRRAEFEQRIAIMLCRAAVIVVPVAFILSNLI